MRHGIRLTFAAAVLTGFWLFAALGLFDLDVQAPLHTQELIYGLAVILPCVLAGAIIGRWWAAALAVVLALAVLVPEQCEAVRFAPDAGGRVCGGVDYDDLLVLLAAAVPSILAGVVAAKGIARFSAGSVEDGP